MIGGGWGGLRVTELHKEHGVHYHFLCNQRLAVDVIRGVGRKFGVGRIQVCKCRMNEPDRMGQYLADYLKPGRDKVFGKGGGRARLWAKFGEVEHTRVSDIVFDCAEWRYRRERGLGWLGFHVENWLRRIWWMCEGNEFECVWKLAKEEANFHFLPLIANGQWRPNEGRWGISLPPSERLSAGEVPF